METLLPKQQGKRIISHKKSPKGAGWINSVLQQQHFPICYLHACLPIGLLHGFNLVRWLQTSHDHMTSRCQTEKLGHIFLLYFPPISLARITSQALSQRRSKGQELLWLAQGRLITNYLAERADGGQRCPAGNERMQGSGSKKLGWGGTRRVCW